MTQPPDWPKESAKERKEREAQEAADTARKDRDRRAKLSLRELVEDLSPELTWNLDHLQPWIAMWERVAAGETVLGMCAVPIQSGKTETTLHGIVYTLLRHPRWRFVLFTYSFDRAKKLAKRLRELARLAGVGPAPGWDEIKQWANADGGGVTAMSAEQSSLGEPCEVLICDDPLDEYGAREQRVRDDVDDAIIRYTSRAKVRGASGVIQQGSVLLVMSRWHPDDPYGRRLGRTAEHWHHVTSAALRYDDDGAPHSFAEQVWPVQLLLRKYATLHEKDPSDIEWNAQFQNDPKLVVDAKFRADPARYPRLPDWNYRLAYGVDLAFTAGEGSDFFAICAIKVIGTKIYVLEFARHKLDLHQIESTCRQWQSRYGHGPIFTYVSGPEVGNVRELMRRQLPFAPMRARYNKLVRAEPTIKRWNDLDVVLPSGPAWVEPTIKRFTLFTGEQKARGDDEIDALVSACDGACGTGTSGPGVRLVGTSYPGF
jgi:hypothetical protein